MMDIELGDGMEKELARLLDMINYTPFYQAVGNIMEDAVASQFETQGAYFQRGMDWTPLKPATIEDRVRHGYSPNQILMRHSGDAGLAGSISSSVIGNSVVVSTNKFYGPYLFFGTKFMPARPFFPLVDVGLPPDVMEDIQDAFSTFLKLQFI